MASTRLARKVRRHGWYFAALLTPLVVWVVLRLVPSLDAEFSAGGFHVAIMAVVAACALAVAAMAARAAGRIRQPRVVILASGTLAVGMLLLGHGLLTPNTLGNPVNQWVSRLPYLAFIAFAVALGLTSRTSTGPMMRAIARHPLATIASVAIPTAAFVGYLVASPLALHGDGPVASESTIRTAIAIACVAVLLPVSWVFWRRFRLSLDVVQASLSIAAVMTATAAISLDFGELWRLSWWDYHGCLLAGFVGIAYAVLSRWKATATAASALEHAFDHDPLALISQNYPKPLRELVRAMEAKDSYTHGHSARTAALAVSIGVRMGLDADSLRVLAQGTYLHDIGKLAIPDEILNKPGRLDDDERRVIETHPAIGAELAAGHRVLEPCLPIIRHHHERFDGEGYPAGLAGEAIPLLARVAAVADVWDALITDRAYRPGWAPQRALDHIVDGAGAHLDPQVVAVLLDIAAEMGVTPSGVNGDSAAIASALDDCHDSGQACTPALTPQLLARVEAAALRHSPVRPH